MLALAKSKTAERRVMTISSALNAGVAGLTANSTRLATIADNISNAATSGYRRVATDFNSIVLSDGGRSYTAGGVTVSNYREISQRGSIISTGNATDLAVTGEGFFAVSSQAEYEADGEDARVLLTSTGGFYENEDGYLVTKSGYMLLGWAANVDGTIPTMVRDSQEGLEPVQITSSLTADPTKNVELSMNLRAENTVYHAPGDLPDPHNEAIEYYDNLGMPQNLGFEFTPVNPASSTATPTNQWEVVITDSGQNGAIIGEYVIDFASDSANGGLIDNVAAVGASPTWDPVTGLIALTVGTAPATNTITLDIGSQYDSNGFTQLSADTMKTSSDVDGSQVGDRLGFEIDSNGNVIAKFDTGVDKVLFQVPLAVVPNVNGLWVMDNQMMATSPESGGFYLWDAGDGPTAGISSYALEESAVDVAKELTNLIQTQRAYTSNAKVITTVDEMLQETTNMKR